MRNRLIVERAQEDQMRPNDALRSLLQTERARQLSMGSAAEGGRRVRRSLSCVLVESRLTVSKDNLSPSRRNSPQFGRNSTISRLNSHSCNLSSSLRPTRLKSSHPVLEIAFKIIVKLLSPMQTPTICQIRTLRMLHSCWRNWVRNDVRMGLRFATDSLRLSSQRSGGN